MARDFGFLGLWEPKGEGTHRPGNPKARDFGFLGLRGVDAGSVVTSGSGQCRKWLLPGMLFNLQSMALFVYFS